METEEIKNQEPKKASKNNVLYIIIPIIITLIVMAFLFYLDSMKITPENNQNNNNNITDYRPKPVSPADNPARSEELPSESATYGCAGLKQLETQTLKQPDAIWEIKKDGSTNTVSLGRYRIIAPKNVFFDVKRFWLYFFSDKLGQDDGAFSLESSYVSGIRLIVNDYENKIKLGGEEYMLIELDYPLGDLYPYNQATTLDFEILVDLKCKNIQNGACIDNSGKSLDYINGADIISQLRIFATGCQEFTKDFEFPANFKY